jgi:hypothetical protein
MNSGVKTTKRNGREKRQREAMELKRYRWMESTTERWEAREQRQIEQLDNARWELVDRRGRPGNAVLLEQGGRRKEDQ